MGGFELGLGSGLVAVEADAVAEGDVGVNFDIALDLLPVILVVTDFLQ